jgi:hypothetical protein
MIWMLEIAIFIVFLNKKLIIFCKIPYHYAWYPGTAVGRAVIHQSNAINRRGVT